MSVILELPKKGYYRHSYFFITRRKINCYTSLPLTALNSSEAWSRKLVILYFEGRFIIAGEL